MKSQAVLSTHLHKNVMLSLACRIVGSAGCVLMTDMLSGGSSPKIFGVLCSEAFTITDKASHRPVQCIKSPKHCGKTTAGEDADPEGLQLEG